MDWNLPTGPAHDHPDWSTLEIDTLEIDTPKPTTKTPLSIPKDRSAPKGNPQSAPPRPIPHWERWSVTGPPTRPMPFDSPNTATPPTDRKCTQGHSIPTRPNGTMIPTSGDLEVFAESSNVAALPSPRQTTLHPDIREFIESVTGSQKPEFLLPVATSLATSNSATLQPSTSLTFTLTGIYCEPCRLEACKSSKSRSSLSSTPLNSKSR